MTTLSICLTSILIALSLYLMLTHFIEGKVATEVNKKMMEQDERIRLLLTLTNKVNDEDLDDLILMLSHWRKRWKSPDGTAWVKKTSSSEEAKE